MQNAPIELTNLNEISDDKISTYEPNLFKDYIGQEKIIDKLKLYVKASLIRDEAIDHILLFGPPGLGKTTLAKVIATELGSNLKITSAPILERAGDLVSILSNLKNRDVLFIDEIHRLSKNVEEILYGAMENFTIDMMIGQGVAAKSIRLPLKSFTLIGATTQTGLISGPLHTRFGIIERLEYYNDESLTNIIIKNAEYFKINISHKAAIEIARRSRGTPRIVKRIFKRVRDFALVRNKSKIDIKTANEALLFLGIDELGLNSIDRKLLSHMINDFNGGPVGIDTLSAITGEDRNSIEESVEPYLLRKGFIQKTSRGRLINPNIIKKLKLKLENS